MGRPSPVGYWLGLTSDHVLPGTLFALIAYAQAYSVYQVLQASGTAGGLDPNARGWLIAQKCLTVLFFLLAAYLCTVRAPRRGPRAGPFGAVVAVAGTFVLTSLGLLPPVEPSPERTIPSLVLMIVGILFSLFALASLGRCFGIFPEARGLVRHGPYRYVRHPLYLGEIISSAGLVLPALSPASAGLFLLFVALQYARAILEERALAEAIPEYAEYRQHTWRIIPGIH